MSEAARLKALNRYEIMDSQREAIFDDLTKLAAEICDAPYGLLSLVDDSRAWFKATYGIDLKEAKRCVSFCDHAVREPRMFVVTNAMEDSRFRDNPYVIGEPKIRFYAGTPLITPDGQIIGSLCVLSPTPKTLTDGQCRALERLGAMVIQLLEGRLNSRMTHNSAQILGLLNAVAVAANATSDPLTTINCCMEEVSRFMGAEVAQYHHLAKSDAIYTKPAPWFSIDEIKYAPLKACVEGTGFTTGTALGNRAFDTREFAYENKVENSASVPCSVIYSTLGLKSAFAFPVFIGAEVVGVFEFTFAQAIQVDEDLKRITAHLAAQIASVLQRRRAEEILEKQMRFQEAILDSIADGIVACDETGAVHIFNRAAQEFHGRNADRSLTPDQLAEYYQLYHSNGKDMMRTEEIPLIKTFNGETVKDYEMVVLTADKQPRNLITNGRLMFDKSGRRLGAVVSLQDITEQKKDKAAIDMNNRIFNSLVNHSPIGISGLDKDFRFNIWNPAMEKMYGFKAEEVLGTFGPYPDSARHPTRMAKSIGKNGGGIQFEATRQRKDGSDIEVHTTVLPTHDAYGEVIGYLAIVIDISDMKQRELSLREINRTLKAATDQKSAFLANMSHELRTPLNGVIGMAEIILDTELNTEQRKYVEVLQQSADNLLAIISDILDFSKVEAGRLDLENVNFSIDQLLSDVFGSVEVTATRKEIEVSRWVSGKGHHQLMGDPTRIRQVILNLMSNAIKFTAEGSVRAMIELEPVGRDQTQLRVEVVDTGIGIDQATIGNLFQAFAQADSSTTRNYGGSGLGLSISKKLIELMKGEMGVNSEVGVGSTFWFTLTLPNGVTEVEQQHGAAQRREAPSSVQPLRILLAEDDSTNRSIALLMLEKLGVRAETVATGTEVLEALKGSQYDMILMDCQMPDMDGYATSRVIRENNELDSLPIIALTAHALKGDREKCLAAGMTDFLSKPIKLNDLEAAIHRNIKPSLAKTS